MTVKKKRTKVLPNLSKIKITSDNIDEVLKGIIGEGDDTEPEFIIVDLFCGAGGTTTGIEMARLDGRKVAKVIACVNHDPLAIISHWRNHPGVLHFEEDIRTLDLSALIKIVAFYRAFFPNAKLILWASLECTNFSKAKGGQPRDADSRTLADHLHRYIQAIEPDLIHIENVVEFMSWGPLDANGKPMSRKNGEDWLRWRKSICAYGYTDDWRELNSADFGAYTSRNRLFGQFVRHGLPIVWPEATHSKKPTLQNLNGAYFQDSFGFVKRLEQWKPVKEVLNFADEGESIFSRSKPLVEKTLERIYAGLIKFVASGDKSFISKYFSGRPKDKNISVSGPAGTIKCRDGQALVSASFITQRNSGDAKSRVIDVEGPTRTITCTGGNQDLVQPKFLLQTYAANSKSNNVFSVDNPGRTITTRDSTQLVNPQFLTGYYGNGDNTSSVESPCPTIPTKDRFGVVNPEYFIDKHFGTQQNQSIDQPAGTILPTDKHRLVQCDPFIMPTNFSNQPKSIEEPAPTLTASRHHHYIVNPSHGGHSTSTDAPCPVIIARQDKAPLYLIQALKGNYTVPIYEDDSMAMIKIKQFMSVYGLVDIKMRMLRVAELIKIQGFPDDYILEGNQADQKKFIGNSVHPLVPKAWYEAMAGYYVTEKQQIA